MINKLFKFLFGSKELVEAGEMRETRLTRKAQDPINRMNQTPSRVNNDDSNDDDYFCHTNPLSPLHSVNHSVGHIFDSPSSDNSHSYHHDSSSDCSSSYDSSSCDSSSSYDSGCSYDSGSSSDSGSCGGSD